MGRDREGNQRMKRHAEIRRPAAAIDDGARRNDSSARSSRHVHRLARRPAGRHDVLDDDDAVGGVEVKSASQGQYAVLPLGEEGAHPERARDFVADDDTAQGRRKNRRRAGVVKRRGKGPAQRLGVTRMLQDQRALQVSRAVQAGRQSKMSFEQRARLAEQSQDIDGIRHFLNVSSKSCRIRLYSSAQLVSSVKLWFSTG